MASQTMASHAWPFLIARGRRAGYRTLLAPQPFLTEGDDALLENNVQPSGLHDRPQILNLITRTGRPVSVVHATHRLTAADLGLTDDPKDEHGRPLHLLYGFVRPRTRTVDLVDLRTAQAVILEVYRQFLDDEANFTIRAGQPFPLRTAQNESVARPKAKPAAGPASNQRRRPSRTFIAAASALLCAVFLLLTLMNLGHEPAPAKNSCETGRGVNCTLEHSRTPGLSNPFRAPHPKTDRVGG
jgi:hypothetical protein